MDIANNIKEHVNFVKVQKKKRNNIRIFDLNNLRADSHFLSSEELSFDNLISLMQKPSRDRSNIDIHVIQHYLQQTELNKKINSSEDIKKFQKLLYFIALNIQYVYLKNSDILFNQGEFADSFFILFKGKINVLRNNNYSKELSGEEYLNIVYKIYHKKQLKTKAITTIKDNIDKFYVNEKDLPLLNIHVFLTILNENIKKKPSRKDIKELFIKYGINSNELLINFDILESIENPSQYLSKIITKIIKYYFQKESFDYNVYSYVNLPITNEVFITDSELIMNMPTGKVFGDMAFENKTLVRNATLQASEDCFIGKISHQIYQDYIHAEQQIFLRGEVRFFIDNFFMKSIKPSLFKKNFLQDFIYLEMSKGAYLSKQGKNLSNLFFIKEGEIELNIEINIFELKQLILNLCKKADIQNEIVKELENYRTSKQSESEILKKRKYKICIIGKKEIVCLESFTYQLPILFTTKVLSDKALLYRIDVKKANKILMEDSQSFIQLNTLTKMRIELIVNRLYEALKFQIKYVEDMLFKKNNTSSEKVVHKVPDSGNNLIQNKTKIIDSKYYHTIVNNQSPLIKQRIEGDLLITNLNLSSRLKNFNTITQDSNSTNHYIQNIKLVINKSTSNKESNRSESQLEEYKFKKFQEKNTIIQFRINRESKKKIVSSLDLPMINSMIVSGNMESNSIPESYRYNEIGKSPKEKKIIKLKKNDRRNKSLAETNRSNHVKIITEYKFLNLSDKKELIEGESHGYKLHRQSPSLNFESNMKNFQKENCKFKHLFIYKKK